MTQFRSDENTKRITDLFSSLQVIGDFFNENKLEQLFSFRENFEKKSYVDHNWTVL